MFVQYDCNDTNEMTSVVYKFLDTKLRGESSQKCWSTSESISNIPVIKRRIDKPEYYGRYKQGHKCTFSTYLTKNMGLMQLQKILKIINYKIIELKDKNICCRCYELIKNVHEMRLNQDKLKH